MRFARPIIILVSLLFCLSLTAKSKSDLSTLQLAVKSKPGDAKLWNKLGIALVNAGKRKQAIKAFTKASTLKKGWWVPLDYLGRLHTTQGNFKKALPLLERAFKLSKNDIGVLQRLVSVHIFLGKLKNATILLDGGLKRKPKSAKLLLLKAKLQVAGKKINEATKTYRQVIKVAPKNEEAYEELYLLSAALGGKGMKRLYAAAKKNLPKAAITHNLAGLLALKKKRIRRAVGHFKRALAANPRNHVAYLLLCTVYGISKQYKRMQAIAQKAMQIHPRMINAYICNARALHLMGKHDLAYRVAQKALKINPASDLPYKQLALYWGFKKKPRKAAEFWEKAMARNKGQLRYVLSAGISRRAAGDFKKALAHFEGIVKRLPNDPAAHFQIALTVVRSSADLERAMKHMRIAMKSSKKVRVVRAMHNHIRLLYAHYKLFCAARKNPALVKTRASALTFLKKFEELTYIAKSDMNKGARAIMDKALKHCK